MNLLPRVSRRVERWLPGAVILLYHRVVAESADPQLLCVKPENFAAHMDVLRRHYRPTSLRDLRSRMKFGNVPPRTVVVTFDDGYADNFDNARPILHDAGIPASIFVTSDHVGLADEFWWDEVESIVLRTEHLPGELDIDIEGERTRFVVDDGDRPPNPKWHVFESAKENSRYHLYLKVVDAMKRLPAVRQKQMLTALADWASSPKNSESSRRAMTADQLLALTAGRLIEVGAHTRTHACLSSLRPAEQRREIEGSLETLGNLIGQPIESFAYPFGGMEDYGEETVGLVRDAGFSVACANRPGRATCLSDPHQLPRWVVRDWNGEEFFQQLQSWFA